ncbi:hypothetical protein L3X38_027163 [Prunus dulcis]|uniref:Uncharacterized protein n=1 Tax=Prunus dulcis TaxID=3755 RepID=A0AAD4VPY1_PRUDU|nr:hypothetical protein L3X38_027163 [Prunus dulcis]
MSSVIRRSYTIESIRSPWQNSSVRTVRDANRDINNQKIKSGLMLPSRASKFQRRQRNRVLKIKNEFGGWLTGEREVRDAFQSYLFNLFLSTGLSDFQEILEYVNPSVTEAMDLELTKPFTPDEIYLA